MLKFHGDYRLCVVDLGGGVVIAELDEGVGQRLIVCFEVFGASMPVAYLLCGLGAQAGEVVGQELAERLLVKVAKLFVKCLNLAVILVVDVSQVG